MSVAPVSITLCGNVFQPVRSTAFDIVNLRPASATWPKTCLNRLLPVREKPRAVLATIPLAAGTVEDTAFDVAAVGLFRFSRRGQ